MDLHAQMGAAALLATYVWVGAGIYHFAAFPGLSFASWQAVLYFTAGTIMAAAVFSLTDNLLTKALVKVITHFPLSRDAEIEAWRVRRVGWLVVFLMVGSVLAAAHGVTRLLAIR